MKSLFKLSALACALLCSSAFAMNVTSSDKTLTGGTAAPQQTLPVALSPLLGGVVYTVSCPITVPAPVDMQFGMTCSMTSGCMYFGTSLSDGTTINSYGQAALKAGTVIFTVQQISIPGITTPDDSTLNFFNLDQSTSVTVGTCKASVITNLSNNK